MGVREIAWSVAPALMADRAARIEREGRAGRVTFAEEFVAAHGDRVLHGPFTGMRYQPQGNVAVGKLLGTYEQELTPWLVEAGSKADAIVDLGAADGYFAVGMALSNPGTPVWAFELSRVARAELAEHQSLNGTQVIVRKRATSRAVRRLPLGGALVLCDIEGAEGRVLDRAAVTAMRSATVIVEIHDLFVPGVGDAIAKRFAESHRCERVNCSPREPATYPELSVLPAHLRAAAVDEFRGDKGAYWLRFTPRGFVRRPR